MAMNISEYARHRGVSHVAVIKAINDGRIEREADGSIDPVKADEAWSKNTNQAHSRKRASPAEVPASVQSMGSAGPNFAQSRAIKEAYNARLAKLSYEEKSGQLVSIDSVKISWFGTLRVLRDRTLNLADRLAPLLAAETDPRKVAELLDTELRQILTDAANDVQNLNKPTE
ncbi:MAG: hypothetical protein WC464_08340 [Bdellovibrionales bacterium]